MKHEIVEVKNVVRTQVMFENLQSRSTNTPGIGLVHGPSGYGKTTTTTYIFNELTLTGHQPLYVRCFATDSPSSFLARIMNELNAEPMYPLRKMVDYIVRAMNENSLALFVDEADYIVGQVKTMETIRDLYDSTEQPVILIGMEEIARKVSHRKQLFNRISEWVEFQAADLEDVHMISTSLLDERITVAEDMLDFIRNKSSGEVRRILIALEKIERAALASDEHRIDLETWGDRQLFLSHRR